MLALAGAAFAAPGAPGDRGAVPELVWETKGFVAPESVVFDRVRGQYYVSNMGTWGEGSTPGDGFVSRVSAKGRILDLRWVTGLDNPKGLALANERLYVGDDADLVEIDPQAGAVTAHYAPADGPGGFNDCTADPAGDGESTPLLRLPRGAADHHHVLDRDLLVIPLVLDNAVRAYHWHRNSRRNPV